MQNSNLVPAEPRGKRLWPKVGGRVAGAGPLRPGVGAAAATAASDQFTPGAETRERWRPREKGRDRHRDRDHRRERLPEAKIKVGAAEADIGQLRRESQFGRHKETKSPNREAETVA